METRASPDLNILNLPLKFIIGRALHKNVHRTLICKGINKLPGPVWPYLAYARHTNRHSLQAVASRANLQIKLLENCNLCRKWLVCALRLSRLLAPPVSRTGMSVCVQRALPTKTMLDYA